MKHSHGFDEIMIVNPSEPGFSTNQGVRLMRFHYGEPPDMGYYAQPPETYGYYAQPPETYGYNAEPPEMSGWGEAGMYGEMEPGYGQYEPVGYFAEEYPAMGYGEEYSSQPVGQYESMGQYGQMPEMVGYG